MGLEVQCSQCAKRFAASEELAGQRVACPGCGGTIEVRRPAPTPNPTALTIQCSHCARSFAAQPELAGKRVACPGCTAPIDVPQGPASPSALPPQRTVVAAASQEVGCRCGRRFAAAPELLGKQVQCPGCGGTMVVQPTPPTTVAATSAATGPAIPPVVQASLISPGTGSNPAAAPTSSPSAPVQAPAAATSGGYASLQGGYAPATTAPGAGRPRWKQDVPPPSGSWLSRHKLMLGVGITTLLCLLILLLAGQWLPALGVFVVGIGMTAAGLLPQKQESGESRRDSGSDGSGGTLAAGGGGAVIAFLFVARIFLRVTGRMDGDTDAGSTVLTIAAYGGGVVAFVALAYGVYRLGKWLGYYRVLGSGYVGLALLGTVIALSSGIGTAAFNNTASVSAEPFPIANTEPAAHPDLGAARTIERGVRMVQVRLPVPHGQPGSMSRLYVYYPEGDHEAKSLPCMLIAPAGATVVSGMGLARGDQAEHIPYVHAGCIVVAYEVDGPLSNPEAANSRQWSLAFEAYQNSMAGLVNARHALDFALAKIPEIDPERIYTAGHSSAGRQALLLAAHEPRIKACIAYAAVSNVPKEARPYRGHLRSVLGNVDEFLVKSSPHAHLDRLQCPVFLFHAEDDEIVEPYQSRELEAALKSRGGQVTLRIALNGGHYDPMIRGGIQQGIAWLKKIDSGLGEAAGGNRETGPSSQPSAQPSPGQVAAANGLERSNSPDGEVPLGPNGMRPGLPGSGNQAMGGMGGRSVEGQGSGGPGSGGPAFHGGGGFGGLRPESGDTRPGGPRPRIPGSIPRPTIPGRPQIPGRPEFPQPGRSGFGGGLSPDASPLEKINSDQLHDLVIGLGAIAAGRLEADELDETKQLEVARRVFELAGEHENASVRFAARSAIHRVVVPAALDDLIALMKGAEDDLLIRECIRGLVQIKDPRAAKQLIQFLPDRRYRSTVSIALRRFGGELVEEPLGEMAAHEDPKVRAEVCRLLLSIGTKSSIPVLSRLSNSDPDPSVKRSAKMALSKIERMP